jgi:hypothetical protein
MALLQAVPRFQERPAEAQAHAHVSHSFTFCLTLCRQLRLARSAYNSSWEPAQS